MEVIAALAAMGRSSFLLRSLLLYLCEPECLFGLMLVFVLFLATALLIITLSNFLDPGPVICGLYMGPSNNYCRKNHF
jgi:hypothetical protein